MSSRPTLSDMLRETVVVQDSGMRCEGLLLRPAATATRPCVLIAPTIRGRSDFEEQRARALADEGYAALVMDLYGTGQQDEPIARKRERMNALLADRPALSRRLQAWVQAARSLQGVEGGRLAAVGYCFGGLCVLDLARSGADIAGVASFHAVLKEPDAEATAPIRAKVLVLHGWDDPLAPPAAVLALAGELSAKGADWQIHAYGNTLHSFTNPAANNKEAGTLYDASANRRSWAAMTAFLAELFGR
jgi:dienelactone hydrolase